MRGRGDRGEVRGASVVVAILAVAVTVGVGATVWANRHTTDTEGLRDDAVDQAMDPDGGQLRRPDNWPAPEPVLALATVVHFTGDGSPVVAVLDQAQVVGGSDGSTPDTATCASASTALDGIGSQDSYRVLVASTPDPVLAELGADAATALAGTLQACTGGGGDPAVEVEQLRVVLAYFDMRRTEIERAAA